MTAGAAGGGGFSHEAFFYRGEDQFLAAAGAFIAEGVTNGEPVLAVVNALRIDQLQTRLGYLADSVEFADMASLGANPARLIPAWVDFVRRRGGGGRFMRGVGEPIDAHRSPAALAECQRSEALMNLAFADPLALGAGSPAAWRLMCSYDLAALTPEVIDEALRSHPLCLDVEHSWVSAAYQGLDGIRAPFEAPLPPPVAPGAEHTFADEAALSSIRKAVAAFAVAQGLDPERAHDLVVAVNEVATNSVRHAGGRGVLRMWRDGDSVVCEVHDGGVIEDAMAGRTLPQWNELSGRGLWMVNQLCDLAQFRTVAGGTVARLHMIL